MAVTQGSSLVNDLAKTLTSQIAAGVPTRTQFGADAVAFGWSSGLPRGLWSFVSTASVEGSGFNAVHVDPSGTPAGKVVEGGTKNAAVTVSTTSHALAKYAGMAQFTMEQSTYSDALPQVVTQVLVSQALAALEQDCMTQLDVGAGLSQAGDSTWTAAVVGGISKVMGAGGTPGVLVMNAGDFAAAVTEGTLSFNGVDPVPYFLGLAVHVSPKAVAGKAWVLDRGAVVVGESTASPVVVCDPLTLASTNTVRIVADVMAVCVVGNGAGVCELTPTPAP